MARASSAVPAEWHLPTLRATFATEVSKQMHICISSRIGISACTYTVRPHHRALAHMPRMATANQIPVCAYLLNHAQTLSTYLYLTGSFQNSSTSSSIPMAPWTLLRSLLPSARNTCVSQSMVRSAFAQISSVSGRRVSPLSDQGQRCQSL